MKTTMTSRKAGSPREQGLALFVVMVVVVVLTVVVLQLSYTTKIEERVAANRKHLLELQISLPAVARSVLLKLKVDYEEDQQGDEGTEAAGGDGTMPGVPPDGEPNEEPELPEGMTNSGGGGETGTDSRHEVWARMFTESINGLEVEVRIADSEGRIGINQIFELIKSEDAEGDPTDGANDVPEDPDPDPPPPDEEPELEDLLDGEEEEEWEPPTLEERELAVELLSRLIQMVVRYNLDNGFEYESTPLADSAADAIVAWVEARQENEETRVIRRLDPIKNLREVGWELYNGPRNPADDEEDLDEEDDFGFGFGDDASAPLGGLASYLESGMLDLEGFVEIEGGVEAVPEPLGLRHVLCTHTTGKINLNTARPEVVAALLFSFEDLEDAYEIAREIDDYLNSYVEETEEEEGAGDDSSGGQSPGGDSSGALGTDPELEQAPEFNIFESLNDVKAVNEEWEEQQLAEEESEWELIQKDLSHLAVFRSTFFEANLVGERENQTIEGMLVLHRAEGKIQVLSWREIMR